MFTWHYLFQDVGRNLEQAVEELELFLASTKGGDILASNSPLKFYALHPAPLEL